MKRFEELKNKVFQSRAKLLNLHEELVQKFVEREEAIKLALLTLVAGESLLFVGKPGSGKKELVQKIGQAFPEKEEALYTCLITPYTEPWEILGSWNQQKLKEGKMERYKESSILHARIAYLDEIFHGSSSFLNCLLDILDKRHREGGQVYSLPLEALYLGASHIPSQPEYIPFISRIPLVAPLEDNFINQFEKFLVYGLSHDLSQKLERDRSTPLMSWEDIHILRNYLL
ncbi:MAG: hypothetical protein D6785_03955, partial [Planctomycetota bacterium]